MGNKRKPRTSCPYCEYVGRNTRLDIGTHILNEHPDKTKYVPSLSKRMNEWMDKKRNSD